ncbi:uncharacterized protein LOC114755206 isoform X1 [Neltuma alba]|uniref:uncharacterized protein LOC114755206 isoform X1 n=1 Tax=Neltuma alba TaxID=207710 RepID=UPI0010A54611|nr:uncharacterized protein LOC114755206 isoform X1 [Prosopis alba]
MGYRTYVKEREADIPEYSYNFLPISEIIELTRQNNIDYLIDVIGFVTTVGSLEECHFNSETNNRIRLTLSDNLENSVSCVLYDECATNVCMTDFTKMDAPVVILIQLARIGFDEKGKVEICSAFHATKISFNMNYPEVRQFIESAKTFPSPTISTISASVASQTSNPFESTLLSSHPLIPIADIPKQSVDDFFLIKCKVIKLETTHDWKYEACTRCGCKPKEEAGKKTCLSSVCRKRPLYFEWKMRVHYTVEDESGRVVVAFFDKLVREFVGKTLAQLEEELIKKERHYDFPEDLDILVGKTLLLKLKLKKYNAEFPNSSISVSSYTHIADLMDEFNKVGETSEYVADKDSQYVIVDEELTEGSVVPESVPCVTNASIDFESVTCF